MIEAIYNQSRYLWTRIGKVPGKAAILFLALAMALPAPHYSSVAASDLSLAEEAATCAGVYAGVKDNFADENYLKMVHQYYLNSSYNEPEAEEAANRTALAIGKKMIEGVLSEDDVMETAKACSRTFDIPLPTSIDRNTFPHYAAPPKPVIARQEIAPLPPSAKDLACKSASDEYVAILRAMPGRLAAAGTRVTEECDAQGAQCGVSHINSTFYYTLGSICDSLRGAENEISRSCGVENRPEKLDNCS